MVEKILETRFQRARGVIGRYPDEGERYVLQYDDIDERGVHMVGVRQPLQVTWIAGDEITQEATLDPWTGSGSARADRIIEERPDDYLE